MWRAWYTHLYVQVLVAIAAGVLVGHFWPDTGAALKPLGDAFIKAVKMVIAPVIFLTIVTGIAGMRDLGAVGRVAGKALPISCSFPRWRCWWGWWWPMWCAPARG
jgi:aerobic C4-dicarboxylate transport protein